MKKNSWIVALIIALSLVVVGCDTGGGGKDDKDKNKLGDGMVGVWDWTVSDDKKPNTTVNIPLNKPPYTQVEKGNAGSTSAWDASFVTPGAEFKQNNYGGVSTINGTPDTAKDGTAVVRPEKVTVPGPDGKEVSAFSFKGLVKVSSEGRAATEGACFPMVGWEAVPDDATLADLRKATAYSFYVKVNSAVVKRSTTATPSNKWLFKTAICAEGFALEQGHEFKHYFGNASAPKALADGADLSKARYTKNLALETWNKVTVYMDATDTKYNIDQDGHIHQWNRQYKADFIPTTLTKLQWQISLQDQEGITDRNSGDYDIVNGSFEYDVLFYGLELYLPG